jgi:hypothetical protein
MEHGFPRVGASNADDRRRVRVVASHSRTAEPGRGATDARDHRRRVADEVDPGCRPLAAGRSWLAGDPDARTTARAARTLDAVADPSAAIHPRCSAPARHSGSASTAAPFARSPARRASRAPPMSQAARRRCGATRWRAARARLR